jgi:uncharacterized membrane protein SirB2
LQLYASQGFFMQDLYLPIKYSHTSLAMLSLLGFMIRGWWAIRGAALLQQRWVRIAPHLIDTLLLISAILLMIILRQHPGNQDWIAAKLIALVIYIGFGTLAIKRAPTPTSKAFFFGLAIMTFVYILGVAIAHDPASWLELI